LHILLLSVAVVGFGCRGGGPAGSTPTTSSPSTGSFDSGRVDSAVDSGSTVPTDTSDTGEASVCEVVARDGTVRDCLDDVVYCDASPENRTNYDACMACEGGLVDYVIAWAATHGLDPTQTVIDEYDICQHVALPPRPETCSPHMVGEPSDALERLLDPYVAWTGVDSRCFWDPGPDDHSPARPLPARLTTDEELSDYVSCYLMTDYSQTIEVPVEALEALDVASGSYYLRDGYASYVVGLYDDGLVVDNGCGGVGAQPPSLQLEVYRVDPGVASFDEVGCQLSTCAADVRGEPIPE